MEKVKDWTQNFKTRDSGPFRILTGTLICSAYGAYTGDVLYELNKDKVGRYFRRNWVKGSLVVSLSFFTLNEVIYTYLVNNKLYHNFFITYSLSSYIVYNKLHRYLRKTLELQTSVIKKKAQKYSLGLCLFGLFFDTYLDFKRRQKILRSLKNDDCPYILESDDDIEYLLQIMKSKQYNIISYGTMDSGEIGPFVPVTVMHQEKQQAVEQDNKEVAQKLQKAIKKLIKDSEFRKKSIE